MLYIAFLSSARYCSASEICAVSTCSLPSRSAMVRATRKNAVVGAGAVSQALKRRAQNLLGLGGHAAVFSQCGPRQLGVAPHTGQVCAALPLHLAGGGNAGADGGAALPRPRRPGPRTPQAWLPHAGRCGQQRAGDAAAVLLNGAGRAGTLPRGVTQVAALAGVHGGSQHELAGVAGGAVYPAHRDGAVLQGLTQHFQGVAGKFRQFVQKQHTVVGQAHLTGARGSTRRPPWRRCLRCGAGYGRAALSKARCPQAAARPPSRWRWSPALPHRSAAAGCPAGAWPACFLPVPGGPTSSKLCPPAAAISSARRASAWPRTSAISGPSQVPASSKPPGAAGVIASSPQRWRTTSLAMRAG